MAGFPGPARQENVMHLSALLDGVARSSGPEEAVIYGGQRWTYREFADAARRAATALSEAGLRPGDRLAVMTYNTPAFLFAAFGAWYVGATLVPVNHKLQTPEVAYQLRHCGARLAVVDAEIGDRATAADTDVRWLISHPDTAPDGLPADSFEALVAGARPWAGEPGPDDDVAQILYTSGTSGRPKGCVHTHRTIALTAAYTAAAIPLRRDERFLICMPIWHASPLNNWALGTLLLGATVVLQREYGPRVMLETIQRERVTALFGAPIALIAPLRAVPDFADFDLSSVRAWIYGSRPAGRGHRPPSDEGVRVGELPPGVRDERDGTRRGLALPGRAGREGRRDRTRRHARRGPDRVSLVSVTLALLSFCRGGFRSRCPASAPAPLPDSLAGRGIRFGRRLPAPGHHATTIFSPAVRDSGPSRPRRS